MRFVISFGLFDDQVDLEVTQPLVINMGGKEMIFPSNLINVNTHEECLEYAKNSIDSLFDSVKPKLYDKSIAFWSNRDELLYDYWNNNELINVSKWFVSELRKFKFSSIYEVGTSNGRNLKYIYDEFSNIRMGGSDVNKSALDFAKMVLPFNTKLECIDALNMNTDEKYDIVFTHDVLSYIPPDAIDSVIRNCINKSSKYVVHIERKGNKNYILRGPPSTDPEKISDEFKWEPEISDIYNEIGYNTVQRDIQLMDRERISTFTIVDILNQKVISE